ncbi:dihydrofolate reductase [Olsenella profusa]|uniref:dihydrofolate reductase n=1 Tax=Olsenella profusa TaxID=138595 RepID=A0ABS2EZN9_9ACTN|nr:dihydrofolate reductase [Olsenella profusa]MBM6774043.1 dihydrofolate reductase [Olsenella profusa]
MDCKLSAIVAVCDDWGIGLDGGMVVENREDMRHFVACTTGHAVLMGRRTLESFPGGRPLRNRRNVVLTRSRSFSPEGVEVVHSVEEALAAVAGEDEAWVIGGGEVYRQLLPHCTRAEVTRNHCVRPCDTSFPNLDEDPSWEVREVRPGGVTPDGVSFDFVTYVRAGA